MPRIKTKVAPEAEPPIARCAMSISQFARSHDISIDSYFRMAREGIGPAVFKVGHRTLISVEAAEKWRRDREVAAQEQRRAREAAGAGATANSG